MSACRKCACTASAPPLTGSIHDVSRGSKFFEHQRHRHDAISGRIDKILERRAQALYTMPPEGAEWRVAERHVDRIAAALESKRDLTRSILHCDMDMFYAAVELRRDPSLQGQCFAVGQGIVLTASYEARPFGVRSGMATFVAQALCPHLRVVPAHFDEYRRYSDAVMAVLRRYDANLYPRSLDEAYLDVTGYCAEHEMHVEDVVAELRREVQAATDLTISVGAAPNMLLAKIVSDRNKPNGQFCIPPDRDAIVSFMASLPVRKVPGIGQVTERILEAFGIESCGDIWAKRVELSVSLDGIEPLLRMALGMGPTVVAPPAREARKSVGRENTFPPTRDRAELEAYLRHACEQLAVDLDALAFRARTVTLIGKRDTYERFTRARTLSTPSGVASAAELYGIVSQLLALEYVHAQAPLCLRLIGARATSLIDQRAGGKETMLGAWLRGGQGKAPEKQEDRAATEVSLGGHAGGGDAYAGAGGDEQAGTDGDEQAGAGGDEHALFPKETLGAQATIPDAIGAAHTMDTHAAHAAAPHAAAPHAAAPHAAAPQCPLCGQGILVEGDTAEANRLVNDHVDECLVRSALSELSPPRPAPKRGGEPGAGPARRHKRPHMATLTDFFPAR